MPLFKWEQDDNDRSHIILYLALVPAVPQQTIKLTNCSNSSFKSVNFKYFSLHFITLSLTSSYFYELLQCACTFASHALCIKYVIGSLYNVLPVRDDFCKILYACNFLFILFIKINISVYYSVPLNMFSFHFAMLSTYVCTFLCNFLDNKY